MNRFARTTIIFLAGSAALLQAAPIHLATVTDHPFSVNGGGRFTGTLDGKEVFFWCVDNQNYVNIPDGFNAHKTTMDNAVGTPLDSDYDTRFENATFAYSVNGSTTNAEFRYRMAAYLVSQLDESLGGGNGKNQAIQNAIWKGTRISPDSLNTIYNLTDYFTTAEAFVSSNPNSPIFDRYAIVSGFRTGSLADTGSAQVQTFLTQTPEPATFALFGAGLIGLGVLRRRMPKS